MSEQTDPRLSRSCWCGRKREAFVHRVPRLLGGHEFRAMPDLDALARALADEPEYWENEP